MDDTNLTPDDVTTCVCNVTVLDTVKVSVPQKLVTDQDYILMCGIINILSVMVSVPGCVGNILAIKTFIRMGLKDGVTISFMFLSLSDLLYLLVLLAHSIASGFYLTEMQTGYRIWFAIEPFGVYIFLTNAGILVYLLTVLTTTFLAVVRCICVSMPLHFKNTFTRRRSICVLAAFCLVSVASYLPILVYMEMKPEFDRRVNSTRAVLWISSRRDKIKENVWIVRDVFVTFMTQLVVSVCVIVMVRCLNTASRFRDKFRDRSLSFSFHRNSTASPTSSIRSVTETVPTPTETIPSPSSGGAARPSKLSSKELAVVSQVVLISLAYIFCNTPKILIDVAVMFVPELTLGKLYQNLYLFVINVMELVQACNSSIAFLVYMRYNSKFKKSCGLRLAA
ncbi:uncharacterized protein LOC131939289 [Physella acuta]|uniref:uncharacterized protein LOC131939289 n=1 Tax=Physella acuta TaxID=109671 RepID=UPI0027DD5038|nr:uncharacterized protein LOC131939289 [Physella acuta]